MRVISWIGAVMVASLSVATLQAATIELQTRDSKGLAEAIQAAKPGDTIQLPEGTLEITETIKPKSQIKLLGKGQKKTTIYYKGSQPATFINFSECEDVEVAHLTVDGQNNPLVHQGISGGNSRRLWLHHLTVCNLDAKTWGPHGILFSGHNPSCEGGVTDSRITDCHLESIGLNAEYGGGIRLAWGSVRNQVINNTIHRTGRGGIFGDHSPELIIRKNKVTGSGGEGLGIEIWGLCHRSVIEDNEIDHWLSVDSGDQVAVRRNVIGTDDGSLKFLGIEIIASNVVVTDNTVKRGAHIGLSLSNKPVKNNVYWGYNSVKDCIQWGSQFQGDEGAAARHYFHHCTFSDTVRGDSRARYPDDSGHGFRTNGNCKEFVFEDCTFSNNGGLGLQLGGDGIDAFTLLRSTIKGNKLSAVAGPGKYTALEFPGTKATANGDNRLPAPKPFAKPAPVAKFRIPTELRAGTELKFECTSQANKGEIDQRLWDFGDGIPDTGASPVHTFAEPGNYRVTLVVWDKAGRGGRAEKTIRVLAK